jgi:hypothetical protein
MMPGARSRACSANSACTAEYCCIASCATFACQYPMASNPYMISRSCPATSGCTRDFCCQVKGHGPISPLKLYSTQEYGLSPKDVKDTVYCIFLAFCLVTSGFAAGISIFSRVRARRDVRRINVHGPDYLLVRSEALSDLEE